MDLTLPIINLNQIPDINGCTYIWQDDKFDTVPGIYFIYDKKDELLYCGETSNLKKRMNEHFTGDDSSTIKEYKDYLYFVKYISLPLSSNKFDREMLETYFINKREPLFNKAKVAYKTKAEIHAAKEIYFENNKKCALKSELEQEAIEELAEPEECLLNERFLMWRTAVENLLNQEQSQYYEENKDYIANMKIWKESRERKIFLKEIVDKYNMNEDQVMEHAKEYSRNEEESCKENIFTDEKWSHASFTRESLLP